MSIYFKTVAVFLGMAIFLSSTNAQKAAADSTGFPGDHFSLQGALQMFQKASSPEEFEKLLNTQNKNVNNLDLNKDGKIDYVKVTDKSEKQSHAFILQVPVSQNEIRDIAVLVLEKTGDTTAVVQIIGNKEIYGKEIIIEPKGVVSDNVSVNDWSSATHGPSNNYPDDNTSTIVVNVWYWPSVTFIYATVYIPWISPWRWGYYPGWWAPWKPAALYVWQPRCVVYNRSFVAVSTYRVSGARYLYAPSGSVNVSRQSAAVVGPNGVAAGTKTTVTGPAGRSATRVSGVVVGPNGAIRTTTIRRGRL